MPPPVTQRTKNHIPRYPLTFSYVYTDNVDLNIVDIVDVIKVTDMFELRDLFDNLKRISREYHLGTPRNLWTRLKGSHMTIDRHSAEETLEFSLRFLETLWQLGSPPLQDVCQM